MILFLQGGNQEFVQPIEVCNTSQGVIGKKKKGLNISGFISRKETERGALPCTFITYCDLLPRQIPIFI